MQDCMKCNGNGELNCPYCRGTGGEDSFNHCSFCNGEGIIDCFNCAGTGIEETEMAYGIK